jgi:glycosyltransferase involved in cell wall biosynthesis
MANLPGVSFLVPVYNKALHLPAVLRQIARQTGDYPRQYVFVDDESNDGSLAIVRELTADWDNTVIHGQSNKGSAGATNACIALADQPYIKFVDADDLIADAATETLLRALHGSEACLAYGRVTHYGDESEIDLTETVAQPSTEILTDALRLSMKNSLFNPTQCLVRTVAVKETGGCDERVVHSQEYSMTLRLAHRWLMMRVDAPIAYIPHEANRLSNNEGRQLQRVTRALALFLKDHPDVTSDLQRFACRRAAGRSWHYARRRAGAGFFSPWFCRYLTSLVATGTNAGDFVEACCSAFELTEGQP